MAQSGSFHAMTEAMFTAAWAELQILPWKDIKVLGQVPGQKEGSQQSCPDVLDIPPPPHCQPAHILYQLLELFPATNPKPVPAVLLHSRVIFLEFRVLSSVDDQISCPDESSHRNLKITQYLTENSLDKMHQKERRKQPPATKITTDRCFRALLLCCQGRGTPRCSQTRDRNYRISRY